MTLENLEKIFSIFSSLATIFGIPIAIYSLHKTNKTLELTKRSNQEEALTRFEEMLEKYHHIHTKLRPGGELCNKDQDLTHQECADLERYMSLFERSKIFIEDDILSKKHFRDLYGYRMKNLINNPWVKREELTNNANRWQYFLRLYGSLYPKEIYKNHKGETYLKVDVDKIM